MNRTTIYILGIILLLIAWIVPTPSSAQISRTFNYFAEEFEDGQTVSLALHFYKKYAGDTGWRRSLVKTPYFADRDRYTLFAYMPQFVTIKDGQYTVEIPKKYYNKNFYLEIIFDNGYVTPRINLNPLADYTPDSIYIVFGALFIALFAWMRFNTWTDKNVGKYSYSPRNFTTWTRFIRAAFLYTFVTELCFIILVISPGTFVFINKFIGKSDLEYKTLMEFGQYGVLWSIFIITGVLANFPWVNRWEQKFREIMHEFAFIPAESRAVINQLEINLSAFQPNEKIIERVLSAIDEPVCKKEDFLNISNRIPHKWCKLSYIYFRLKEWRTYPKINHFFGAALEKFDDFKKQYEVLKSEIESYNRYIKTGDRDDAENSKEYFPGLVKPIEKEIDALLTKAYSLISIGALATERLPQGRRKVFEFFGLKPYLPPRAFIDWDTNIKSVVAIFLTALIPALFYYFYFNQTQPNPSELPALVPKSSGQALLWAISCVFMHGLTIISVVFFNRWKKNLLANEYEADKSSRVINQHRFIDIAMGGLIGFLVSFLVLVALFILPSLDVLMGDKLVKVINYTALWSSIAAITGLFLQYYLNTSMLYERKSWKEGMLQGSVTAIVASFVAVIFLDKQWIETWYFIIFAATNSFLIGASIGYIFPQGYRRRYKEMSIQENRRSYDRKQVMEPVTLHVDGKKYACNLIDISLGGANLDRSIKTPIGAQALLEIQPVGDLNAVVVRKSKKNTYIHFPYLDSGSTTDLEHYLQA